MALRHTNPTQKRYDRKSGQFVEARAPYNFIPLPEKIVPAPPLLDHDAYHRDALSCHIDVELETLSPTYIRGMMTTEQFERLSGKGSDKLSVAEKEELARFFEVNRRPVIPGSSLRGMLRAIVEIASHGRIRWVAKQPTFTFRAVAAPKDDPLAADYQKVIGRLAANVRAGYFERDGDDWYVRPAKLPNQLPGCAAANEAFLKIKESQIGNRDIPGFVRLSSPNYKPAFYNVRFEARLGRSRFGKAVFVERIGSEGSGLPNKGVLVCSGNMAESGAKSGERSKRTTHALILELDPRAKRIKVSRQAIEDYLKGLTPFQEESLGAWNGNGKKERGCLAERAPVFYVVEDNEVAYFGHSPNFRIPMRLSGSKRAATPHDFVPAELRSDLRPDFADAMFGWVDESADGNSPPDQRAGKVFIGDARCLSETNDIWLSAEPIAPHTLASPKPTTFQHYLVQDKQAGHDPDNKVTLAHYGTPPRETQIRGFKCYWHKGKSPDIRATEKEQSLEKQLTRIRPLKPGVRFGFRIYFENLHPAELGALLWALTLPGERGKTYAHKIGMGKPLGMGAVKLTVKSLVVSDRRKRYAQLFSSEAWHTANEARDPEKFVAAFEKYVLDELGETDKGRRRLAELERIRMLLAMQEWPGPPAAETRYMEIEHQDGGETINEYKERPVLPDPLAVLARTNANVAPQVNKPNNRPSQGGKPVSTSSNYEEGVVIKFGLGPLQDYGFIKPDSGGPDLYVNKSKLARGVTTLRQGQRVRFKRAPSAKGDQAVDVQVIG
ncbi:MAG: CRISPR-associated RAMP family protein [Candidatus Roseilinea sp.]|nr:MAG: CRISPR-associated RAMP family protein [Candidatus Roseilinea sp.]